MVNKQAKPRDVVVCAAGSLPGDLHKLWRTTDPKGYHMEYGYSCMGYEIAGGLGVKIADPSREVFVMVGDGSYLMMGNEIVTLLQEGVKLTIILLNNHGFGSINGLSKACGSQNIYKESFGNRFRYRKEGLLEGEFLSIDYAKNAQSLGAHVIQATNREGLFGALEEARTQKKTTVVVVETAPSLVPGYGAWWDVPIAEVSSRSAVQEARKRYEQNREKERYFL